VVSRPLDRQSVAAPAKVNLTLRVLGRRPDGYHDIESVTTKITLYDGIDVLGGRGPAITIECDNPAIPTDARNLAWKAIDVLRRESGVGEPLTVRLLKRIPAGGGLGGGSSDAAAVLQLVNTRWNLQLGANQLRGLAAQIGSDVAGFLTRGATLLRGRGERTEPVELPWQGWLVLCFPPFGFSTAQVYAQWRPQDGAASPAAEACLSPSVRTSAALDRTLVNDLQQSVYRVEPRMKPLQEFLQESSGRRLHITGSGSTLFACCDTHDEARNLNGVLAEAGRVRSQIVRVLANTSDHE
jgi:4-diphosphocytidyl-2-C-methyl-D-erythritol kinase